MKSCSKCFQSKDESEFYADLYQIDGLKSRCKSCVCAYAKEKYRPGETWAAKNPEKQKESLRRVRSSEKYKIVSKLYDFKWRELGCRAFDLIKLVESQFAAGMTWENYKKDWIIEISGGWETAKPIKKV